jgi:hypothetical protein
LREITPHHQDAVAITIEEPATVFRYHDVSVKCGARAVAPGVNAGSLIVAGGMW